MRPYSRASEVFSSPAPDPLADLGRRRRHERVLAAPVGPALPSQRDALAFPLPEQGPLEHDEGPMTDSMRSTTGESSPVKARFSWTNSMLTPRPVPLPCPQIPRPGSSPPP